MKRLSRHEFDELIIFLVASGVQGSRNMANKLGCADSAIRKHLRMLEEEGRVHNARPGAGRIPDWKLGPRLDKSGAPILPKARSVAKPEPARKVPASYNEIFRINGRDELHHYFFGPAGAPKQSAPVCTACKVEQGKGHLNGCVVALVAA